jgi:hypothetical protein
MVSRPHDILEASAVLLWTRCTLPPSCPGGDCNNLEGSRACFSLGCPPPPRALDEVIRNFPALIFFLFHVSYTGYAGDGTIGVWGPLAPAVMAPQAAYTGRCRFGSRCKLEVVGGLGLREGGFCTT